MEVLIAVILIGGWALWYFNSNKQSAPVPMITLTANGSLYEILPTNATMSMLVKRLADIIEDSGNIISSSQNKETIESRRDLIETKLDELIQISNFTEHKKETFMSIIDEYIDEKMLSPDMQFVELNHKGIDLEKNGEVDAAIEVYEEVIADDFEGNHPYDRLAIIYRKKKDYQNEIRVLEHAISVFKTVSDSRPDKYKKIAKFQERLMRVKELSIGSVRQDVLDKIAEGEFTRKKELLK